MKVLGLDISRNFAVGMVLESLPDQRPLEWFNSFPKKSFQRNKKQYSYHSQALLLTNDSQGVKLFNEVKPDIVILEPTGYWYSHIWVVQAEKLGCQILWKSHQAVASHRKHYGFKNKNDDTDAFILALCYFDQMLPDNQFLQHYNYKAITRLRLAFYERKRLLKALNQNTNQLKQYFEVEFPEIATRSLTNLNKDGINPTIGHLLGISTNRKWPKSSIGLGVSKRTMALVEETHNKQRQLLVTEAEIESLLESREFEPYVKVFKDYGFNGIMAHLLIKVYPLDRFLLPDFKRSKDKKKRDLSLRQFQAYLGLGYEYELSGDSSHNQGKIKKKWQGSTLTRSDLFVWMLATICVGKWQPKTETQCKLKELWASDRIHDEYVLKNGKRTLVTKVLPSFESLGKDGILRMAFTVTRWLFNDLYNELKDLDF